MMYSILSFLESVNIILTYNITSNIPLSNVYIAKLPRKTAQYHPSTHTTFIDARNDVIEYSRDGLQNVSIFSINDKSNS